MPDTAALWNARLAQVSINDQDSSTRQNGSKLDPEGLMRRPHAASSTDLPPQERMLLTKMKNPLKKLGQPRR